jgi:pimeloyl-ACP methyl ester carboxylesterase
MRQTAIHLHGHRLSYRTGGRGPLLLLIHGITSSSASWEPVLAQLATRFTVIAPDLLSHGESAKPRGDYSLGASASLMRDLMVALGHERATIVGHSLGGGIAMQMAYQFPERVERLVLVSSGGLGRQVTPVLRAVALPAAEYVLPLLASPPLVSAGAKLGRWIQQVGLRFGADMAAMAAGFASLQDLESRRAFVHTARSVIDIAGQRVSDRQALSRRGGPDARPLGRPRPDHPRPPRHPRARADARQPAAALRRHRPLPAPRRSGRLRRDADGLHRHHARLRA